MTQTKPLHEQRGISFAELGALLGTREMLKAHIVEENIRGRRYATPHQHDFNMDISCRTNECGSVSCIGGTMGLVMGLDGDAAAGYVEGNGSSDAPLNELFFPNHEKGVCTKYGTIKPRQAIKAINNWLKTGRPHWKDVLGPKQARNA